MMMVNHDHGMMNVDFSKSKREHFGRNNTQELEEEEGVMHAVVDFRNMSLGTLPLTSNINLGIVYKLDISKNNIQVIPESLIARLLNVGVLDVHSNQLRTIPNSIGCLSKLKTLNISGNLLQSLPKTIQNCKALEHLNVNFNQLNKLPDNIGFKLVNLKKLSVNSNKLTFLPSSTSHLTNLCHLDARLNHLGSLPNDLGNLINLEILNISQNFRYLDTLPYSLGLVFSLVELDISHNNISTLPDSMGCLKRLRKLHLEGNPLMSPPPEVVDQGLHVMKEYLREKINRQKSPKKKSWIKKLRTHGTSGGSRLAQAEREGYVMHSDRIINELASPKHMGMFSSRRIFSPKKYFTTML
ncbi:putative leucine-rich repeat domain superfamily [Helianthus annuus]|uniref:Leucine-rich repeat domain superfamily n=1 Tax=Helianthus annuus TaxID=4232 RepID=A0A251TSH8_HELAN|nr:putative leucine-rich repeat domain superfamily [Helianthus annuus]KAJ0532889.1 putative leucine-rich repeat domain superfamily [Helianthus annuus]KAJ0541286.1 putative leucine-rich repeat domain superfamily [Helianthus annuus]KAJ0706367.1 putative leucine-rich repeat domain superfamily [Helianthus annuus]KAJ0891863.1 putative leucine-rich repeat domain superfamily [Helianthus annuus]